MPKFCRAMVTLERTSGLPEDRIVNVFHFEGDDSQTWEEDQDDLAGRLVTFYQAIDTNMSDVLSGAATVDLYDLAQAEPRVPRFTQTFTIVPTSSTGLPEEVAICMSFNGTAESGVNMARRRGRVFLGPWGTNVAEKVANASRPSLTVRNIILAAGVALAEGPDPGDFRMAIFSPTTLAAGGTLADSFNDVVRITIDDAWDIQRRRGAAASSVLGSVV